MVRMNGGRARLFPRFQKHCICLWHCHAWSKERGDRSWGCNISFPWDVWINIYAAFSQTSGDVVAHMLEGILASFLPDILWIHSVSYNLALNGQFQTNSFQMDIFTKLKRKPNPVTKSRFLPQCRNSHHYGFAYPFLHQKLYKQKDLICQKMYFFGNRKFYFFASRAGDTEQKNNLKTMLCVWRLHFVYWILKFHFFL